MNPKPNDEYAYFVLSAWRTVAKGLQEMAGRFASVQDAERTATERGVCRVAVVRDGLRCDLEPFNRVGDGQRPAGSLWFALRAFLPARRSPAALSCGRAIR